MRRTVFDNLRLLVLCLKEVNLGGEAFVSSLFKILLFEGRRP